MRATATTDLLELQEWCRAFDRWTPHPWDAVHRFVIGLYQIPGQKDWGESHLNKWESLASASIHFLIVGEKMRCGIEGNLDRQLDSFDAQPFRGDRVLHHSGKAAQMLIYSAVSNRAARKDRFNLASLSLDLTGLIYCCLCGIPSVSRSMAIQDATLIMTGKL